MLTYHYISLVITHPFLIKQTTTFAYISCLEVYIEIENGVATSDTLRWISQGPLSFVVKHSGYDINGFHFVTRDRDSTRVIQNSDVTLVAEAMHVASGKDKNPITCDMAFYGVIDEIWVVDYHLLKIPLLKIVVI